MGRTVFSQAYTAAPAVRLEPEPKVDICEKWSAWNRFDPDSEEFFRGAEYEAFVDPAQLAREQAEMAALAAAEGNSETSDSTESSVSDQGSPMAVGSDDPAILIAGAYSNHALWEEDMDVVSPTETEWRPTSADSSTIYTSSNIPPMFNSRSPPSDRSGIPAFIPPASFRELTPGIEVESSQSNGSPRSPTIRRTVNITPITISRGQIDPAARSPSPDSSAPPSTPPPYATYGQQAQTLVTPSPPPSVTPRFYSWQHHTIPALPISPSLARGSRDGPLTNPRARISFARIDSSPARIRIPSSVM